jgi:hypothetical protein
VTNDAGALCDEFHYQSNCIIHEIGDSKKSCRIFENSGIISNIYRVKKIGNKTDKLDTSNLERLICSVELKFDFESSL